MKISIDGISRKLFNTYNTRSIDDIYLVSRALAKNLLSLENIPEEAINAVQECMDMFVSD